MRNACKILEGKFDGKKPRRRWKDSIKMVFKQMGWDGME
jgi:hypothetical protein